MYKILSAAIETSLLSGLSRTLPTDASRYRGIEGVKQYAADVAALTKPDNQVFCTGSVEEYDALCQLLVDKGVFTKLNPELRPNSFLARTHESDTARIEGRTFICSSDKSDAGPTNNWRDPAEMEAELLPLFSGCMKGRTMYVIPYCMGPIDSPYSRMGVEVTDSPYAVLNMMLMTRAGDMALKRIGADGTFVPGLHSVGAPLKPGQQDVAWPCVPNVEGKYIVQFPDKGSIVSFGSGYGGNALLGKKCHALRIGSVQARKEGWLAEHMLIACAESPEGKKVYFTAAFPSACGKTNLAMLVPPEEFKGWKITTVGDDIAWLHTGKDGRLYAINPEAGYFGVAPGTGYQSNPAAMETVKSNTIFTNVALTSDGDVWWEGMGAVPESKLIDWRGNEWESKPGVAPAAQPNSRFTVSARQNPSWAPESEDPEGVPVSMIFFGGRRPDTVPLVAQARTVKEGVFKAATIGSLTTAATIGQSGVLRRDPMAMLPFIGYNAADYFQHWLNFFGSDKLTQPPAMFQVNWFRREGGEATGKFLWAGYGQNMRVIEWAIKRIEGKAEGNETEVGVVPKFDEMNWNGLPMSEVAFNELISVKSGEWMKEVQSIANEYFAKFKEAGSPVPAELQAHLIEMAEAFGIKL